MIGSDIFIQNHKFRLRQSENNFILFKSNDNTKALNVFGSFVILSNAIIADDPFYMPYLFTSGIIQSLIIHILVLIFAFLSFLIYSKTWVFGNTFSYEGITAIATSKALSIFVQVAIIYSYFYITLYFAERIPYTLSSLLSLIDGCPSILKNKWLLFYIINIITVVPTLFFKSISSFLFLSYVGNIALIISVIAFFVGVALYDSDQADPVFFSGNGEKTASHISMLCVLHFFNPFIQTIVLRISRPTINNVKGVVLASNIFCLVLCFAVGITGSFFDVNQENGIVFDSFPSNSAYAIIGKIGILIKSIASNCYFVYLISLNLCGLILKGSEEWKLAVFTGGIVVIVANAVILFSDIQIAFLFIKLVGLVLGCILNFGYPSILFLKFFQFSSKRYSFISIFLIVVTIFLCIAIIFDGYVKISDFLS